MKMRAEIHACLKSLIGWGQHSKEEPGRAGGRRGSTSQPLNVLLQRFALLPSCQAPARFSRSPGRQLIPWQGAGAKKEAASSPPSIPLGLAFV